MLRVGNLHRVKDLHGISIDVDALQLFVANKLLARIELCLSVGQAITTHAKILSLAHAFITCTCTHFSFIACTCTHFSFIACTCTHFSFIACTCTHFSFIACTCTHFSFIACTCTHHCSRFVWNFGFRGGVIMTFVVLRHIGCRSQDTPHLCMPSSLVQYIMGSTCMYKRCNPGMYKRLLAHPLLAVL